jgi:MoaA/NifB/PqqE/SkfB family radical SAM enzyme
MIGIDVNKLSGINILACADLADITVNQSALYRLFKKVYQPEYQPNDRIVFYTSHDIPEQLWQHLYQATAKIDISNCFVLICSTKDISQQSQIQADRWTRDNMPLSTAIVSDINSSALKNNYHIPETICPLPWTHLEIKNNGKISPCCIYKGNIGDITVDNLNNVFTGDAMSDLRYKFLNNEKPVGCYVCWKNEESNTISYRQRQLKSQQEFFVDYINSPQLVSLDLKPSNTCNFKCRICSSEYSSQWAQEEQSQPTAVKIHKIRNWVNDNDRIFDQIFDNLLTVLNYDLYGGEPFLIKPLTKLVEKIVEAGRAPDVRLHYNSNGSIYPSHLLHHWSQFQHIDLQFSIDNVGRRFELERGGSWLEVQNNIQTLIDKKLPNLTIGIMPVINIMNVLYLEDLFGWADSLNLPVNPVYLHHPPELSIHHLTAAARKAVLEKYKNSKNSEIQRVINFVSSGVDSNGKKFVEYTRQLDSIRQQSFLNTHKEIAEAMGYTV